MCIRLYKHAAYYIPKGTIMQPTRVLKDRQGNSWVDFVEVNANDLKYNPPLSMRTREEESWRFGGFIVDGATHDLKVKLTRAALERMYPGLARQHDA